MVRDEGRGTVPAPSLGLERAVLAGRGAPRCPPRGRAGLELAAADSRHPPREKALR